MTLVDGRAHIVDHKVIVVPINCARKCNGELSPTNGLAYSAIEYIAVGITLLSVCLTHIEPFGVRTVIKRYAVCVVICKANRSSKAMYGIAVPP